MNELKLAVETTVQTVEESLKGYKVFAVYLSGSRLYGLETKDSDYDLKVYVKPDFETLVLENSNLSKVVSVNKNKVEDVDVKDVRYMQKEFGKLTFQSLHLFQKPVYGKLFSGSENNYKKVVESSQNTKKNLLFSLCGAGEQCLTKNTLKTLARGVFVLELLEKVYNDKLPYNVFELLKKEGKNQKAREVFGFDKNDAEDLAGKLRHEYDFYFLKARELEKSSDLELEETLKTYTMEVFLDVK